MIQEIVRNRAWTEISLFHTRLRLKYCVLVRCLRELIYTPVIACCLPVDTSYSWNSINMGILVHAKG